MSLKKKQTVYRLLSLIMAVLLIIMLVGSAVAWHFSQTINVKFGTLSSTVKGEGQMYFTKDYDTMEEQTRAAYDTCEEIEAEGAVLLLNRTDADGKPALPLSPEEGEKNVTLLGKTSVDVLYGSSGAAEVPVTGNTTFQTAMTDAGFSVNPTVWDFYKTGAGKDYSRSGGGAKMNNVIAEPSSFKINEVPQSAYTADVWNSVQQYGDAAVVVFGRLSGEGCDNPAYGSGDGTGNILELTQEERDLLAKAAELKKQGVIKKIIVILNACSTMELDFLEPSICGQDYGVDACLWMGIVGETGLNAVGDILAGKVNPSGKLADTYCYDNLTSPAIQNAYFTEYANSAEMGLSYTKSDGHNSYYDVYQEGIYVGYRYYETRYEDYVLQNSKVGEYDYATTVAYPFAYGLSYTDFVYSNYAMTETDDTFEFTVDVTNAGKVAGKNAVTVFMQSPYTQYDKDNGVEKAAVELVGYNKTGILQPGETQNLTISVDKSEMRSYDANNAKTYIRDAGTYYFAIGNGAHEALNNILSQKSLDGDTLNGTVDESRMTAAGNAELVIAKTFEGDTPDTTTYAKEENGVEITNKFDHADLNKYDEDASNDVVYVSRSDWAGTMPRAEITADSYTAAAAGLMASQQMVDDMNYRYTPSTDGEMPTLGADNGLCLANFIGVGLDETVNVNGKDYTWDDLCDQLTLYEMAKVIGDAYHNTAYIASVQKPATKDENGPLGLSAALTGGYSAVAYPSADILAATYNQELIERMGVSVGNDCLSITPAYSGLYGPSCNMHRTPYNGRNFEYYSEDPFLSGKTCASVVRGVQSKGVYTYVKHFAVNDQESARDGLCVWTNEQALREIYLEPFRTAVVEGGTNAIMSSFCRLGCVWTGGDKNLITDVLRTEWGMDGVVITDGSMNQYMNVVQGILAGGTHTDFYGNQWSDVLMKCGNDPHVVQAMKTATKHILYTVANSNAMNGISAETKVVSTLPWWKVALIVIDSVLAVLTVVSVVLWIVTKKKIKASADKN